MEFKKWTPLSHVSESILDKVRLAYVFGHRGREALLITKDDEVLACGTNCSGCLGIKQQSLIFRPSPVVELQNKGVKGFSFGGNSVTNAFLVAYTNSGSVYVCGRLIGSADPVTTSSPMLTYFPKKISEVACGVDHCLALSMDGEVYSWGGNDKGQLGTGGLQKCPGPIKVEAALEDLRIIKICCGHDLSVALVDNGEVYAWGANHHGQLCLDRSLFSSYPVKICGLRGADVKEVFCGMFHVLALTNTGKLYVWGKNSGWELGLGNSNDYSTPQENVSMGRIIDIAASSSCSISAAMNEKFQVFVWGDITDCCFRRPFKTSFESLHDVFRCYGIPQIMYKPMVRQDTDTSEFASVLRKAFQDKETCDLTLKAEGKEIFVHRTILRLRSHYFCTFLQDHWLETNQKVVDIDRKYDVIYPYIQYLYTGELEANLEFVPELLSLADEYQDIAFKKRCEKSLLSNMSVENVGHLLPLALKSNATDLLENCMAFTSPRITEVLSTSVVSEWDRDTWKEFSMQCKKRKLYKS